MQYAIYTLLNATVAPLPLDSYYFFRRVNSSTPGVVARLAQLGYLQSSSYLQ